MQTTDEYHNQNDEFFHPLWLGILMLFGVMTVLGLLCCLRIKCGPQIRDLCNRVRGRQTKRSGNSLTDDLSSVANYSYNWPPIYTASRTQSPKLYTLIRNIRSAKLQKQLSIRQNSGDNENEIPPPPTEPEQIQLSVTQPSDDDRTSEIARKFYASMRNTSQCQNSSSLDSCNNDISLTSANLSPIMDHSAKPKRDENMRLFRTPRFFQSIPNTDGLGIII